MKKTTIVFLLLYLFCIGCIVQAEQVIKFVTWEYETRLGLQECIKVFQERNPEIKIEVIDIPAKNYGDKLLIMLTSRENMDLFSVKDMPLYSTYVGRKYVYPLNDLVERDNVDLSIMNKFMDILTINGKYYALPYRSDLWVLYYNKEIFDKAGISYPSNDMTWQEFREKARLVTSGQGNDKIYGAYIHTWKSLACNLGVQKGKTLVDGEYDFLKDGYELYLKMIYEDKSAMSYGKAITSNAHYCTQFEVGKAAMIYMGTWNIRRLISDARVGKHNVDWGIVKSPHWSGIESENTISVITPIAIHNNSNKKEAAWKFVKFMNGEVAARILAQNSTLPARKTPEVLEIYTSIDGFPEGGEKALESPQTYIEFPPHPQAGPIDKILQEEHELIMIKEKTIDQGIASMERRIKELLGK